MIFFAKTTIFNNLNVIAIFFSYDNPKPVKRNEHDDDHIYSRAPSTTDTLDGQV